MKFSSKQKFFFMSDGTNSNEALIAEYGFLTVLVNDKNYE